MMLGIDKCKLIYQQEKLDKFIAKAESEIEANQVRDLDEVLDNV